MSQISMELLSLWDAAPKILEFLTDGAVLNNT